MTDEEKPEADRKALRKALRKAFIVRRDKEREERRKAAAPTRTNRMMAKRKAIKARIKEDLTVDPEKLKEQARKLSEKPERDITGRRGKNLFRAYPWIGGR